MNDRFVKGGYLLWVVVQMVLLMASMGNNGMHPIKKNWIFPLEINESRSFVWSYDWTEFLFYLIVPVLIYYAIKLLRPEPTKEDE